MKQLLILASLILVTATAASATTKDCKKQGGGYQCGDIYVDGSKAESSAEAYAIANQAQLQGQAQGQQQGQTSENNNNNNNDNSNSSSISNTIEGNPKHTTSLNFGASVNFSVPIGHGIQGASCRDTVRLAREMGYDNIALQIFVKCPHVRKLNLTINPGDKG